LNRQFHTEIHQLSHLKKTVKLVENLWGAIPPVIRRDHVKYLEKSNQEHDNLVKAITSKNEVHAKAIMEAHIMRSYQDFLQEKSTK
jgi:DNA-binding GntR family transcriptional regulator